MRRLLTLLILLAMLPASHALADDTVFHSLRQLLAWQDSLPVIPGISL